VPTPTFFDTKVRSTTGGLTTTTTTTKDLGAISLGTHKLKIESSRSDEHYGNKFTVLVQKHDKHVREYLEQTQVQFISNPIHTTSEQ